MTFFFFFFFFFVLFCFFFFFFCFVFFFKKIGFDISCKRDIAVCRGFSLTVSGVEDQISEITTLEFLLHLSAARCMNQSRKEAFIIGG